MNNIYYITPVASAYKVKNDTRWFDWNKQSTRVCDLKDAKEWAEDVKRNKRKLDKLV
jgi:polyferredoxin